MPENAKMMKHKKGNPRPTSDVIMEAGRKLISEMEKPTVTDSKKHISMLLARSRSLDVLSSPSIHASEKFRTNLNEKDSSSSTSLSDESPKSNKSTARFKNDSASLSGASTSSSHNNDFSLLKENSELNNNNNSNESYKNSSTRSSGSSTSSSRSNYSVSSKTNHNKLGRRSSSSTAEGASTFQEVKLNEPIRITGYLEKRSKVLGWKRFWFVLDGRLLTYYKSKADYESLSACCGCINLGIASTVRPIQIRGCKGYPLQIVTRSQVYYLRSPEKPVLEQWLLAIQEAASSSPSSAVLTPWNSCLGSQYFRNSLASQSQWSLNNSTEDVNTDISGRLGNLPDSFYQKRDKGSLIYPSPPNLPHLSPVIHKCHSFASLQTPVINNFELGREDIYGRRVLLSSSENIRDLDKDQRNMESGLKMQHSTSLLVLDSSPQAAELRKELTRKLSTGSNNSKHSDQTTNNQEDGSVPTPKFLLFSTKRKSQTGDDESHHYDEIGDFVEGKKHYENCDAQNSPTSERSQPNSKRNSLRGESAERESNIYEHVETGGDPAQLGLDPAVPPPPPMAWDPSNEAISTNMNKRFPPHRMTASSNRNSLVSISEVPEDLSSISPSPIKTPVLSSIPESSWRSGVEPFKSFSKPYSEDDLSSCRSESFRSLPCAEKISKKKKGKAAIGGFFAKVFGKNKAKGGKSASHDNLHKPMIITGPVDLRKQVQMQELPARKHSNYPFKKPSVAKSGATNATAAMQQLSTVEQSTKTSPTIAGSRMTINNTIVMDELKQKVGHITLKRTSSRSSSGSDSEPPVGKESAKTDKKQDKLPTEAKVPYFPRPIKTDAIKSTPVLILQQQQPGKSESNTDDDIVETRKSENEIQTESICFTSDVETSSVSSTLPKLGQNVDSTIDNTDAQKPPPLPKKSAKLRVNTDELGTEEAKGIDYSVTQLRKPQNATDTELDFQNKLAKFNRLSRTLSANFMAALHPSHATLLQGPMNRSNSYKVRKGKTEDTLPPLPPKKKNAKGMISASTGAIALYDVPSNNKPVFAKSPKTSTESFDNTLSESEEKSISAYIRDLTKKNSTPDIVLSGSNCNFKSICLRDIMTDAKEFRKTLKSESEENVNIHKSSPSIPTGKPPKPKPPAKPKSLDLGYNRIKRNSESSVSSDSGSDLANTPINSSQSVGQVLGIRTNQTTTSNKLSNGNAVPNLKDGLADKNITITDNSPTMCPIHHTSQMHNDFALSIDARTPDSIASTSYSDKMVPDSLATTPETDIILSSCSDNNNQIICGMESDIEPLSINKLEIVIRDNDGSPIIQTPDNESRLDSLERKSAKSISVTPSDNSDCIPPAIYQNLKFATVNTLIQEFETVEENEEEMSELYDDFPSEFYTPTPSSFSGYTPSDVSTTSSEENSSSVVLPLKKHARIDAIRNSGMEQLEAFLHYGSSSSSGERSFESCVDSFPEDRSKLSSSTSTPLSLNHSFNNNNNGSETKLSNIIPPPPQFLNGSSATTSNGGGSTNRTGAISRLGHSSAVGHLQKILTSDAK